MTLDLRETLGSIGRNLARSSKQRIGSLREIEISGGKIRLEAYVEALLGGRS